jgi:hypothetical protein
VQERCHQLETISQNATEESNRLRSAFSVKEKHFNNEVRKREREFEKLKEQLQNCLREPASILNNARVENTINGDVRLALGGNLQNSVAMSSDEDLNSPVVEETDRVELLEHENANMRQLLASINQILGEMRKTAHLTMEQDEEPVDLSKQTLTLPVAWIYEKVKDDIEASLATISDFIRLQ